MRAERAVRLRPMLRQVGLSPNEVRRSAAATLGLVCIGGAAALARWSLWWPHRDMRQMFATAATVGLGVVGLLALGIALGSSSDRGRTVIVLTVVGAVALGGVAGFMVLQSATASAR